MIFVTVGTHEQPFNRLISCLDEAHGSGIIQEDIIMQTGFSTYQPKYCTWQKMFFYDDMIKNMARARVIITHGGPASFIMALQQGKIPIVVPRQKQYGEHINNHQLNFVREVAKRQGNVILIENIEELADTILRYDQIIETMPVGIKDHNCSFNIELEKIVKELLPE